MYFAASRLGLAVCILLFPFLVIHLAGFGRSAEHAFIPRPFGVAFCRYADGDNWIVRSVSHAGGHLVSGLNVEISVVYQLFITKSDTFKLASFLGKRHFLYLNCSLD